jgi:radical SAM superfamily enzyme
MGLQYQKIMGVTIITSPNQKATQAYKLFSEGKKPFEVAIELGMRKTSNQVIW